MQTAAEGPRKSDKYIPWYFVAFFAVLFVLDGFFVYMATSTHTGVVETGSYNRGLNYNETVAASVAQAELGWQATVVYDRAGKVTVSLLSEEGTPLENAEIKAHFFRPTQADDDFLLPLEELVQGQYGADVRPAPGLWDIRVFATWKQQHYQITKRVIVPQT